MTDSTRRRFLRSATTATATAALVGFAGCAGVLSEDGRTAEDRRTTTDDYSLPEATANAEVEMGPDGTNR